jgi:hypothetical protein
LAVEVLLDRNQEPVPTPRHRFEKSWSIRIVGQRGAYLADAEIQTLIEVDDQTIGPDRLPEFLTGDQLPGMAGEQREYTERLGPQSEADTGFAELALFQIQFKNAEAQNRAKRLWHHDNCRLYTGRLAATLI